MSRGLTCALLAMGVLFAQEPEKLEIRGVVKEIGLNAGLPGAQITVYQFAISGERSEFAKGVTDSQGSFEFHPDRPGNYYVEAMKPGYFADSVEATGPETRNALVSGKPVEQPSSTGTLVSLKKDHPRELLRLGLMRPAEVTGRVLDEKDKPLEGLQVEALEPGSSSTPLGRAKARTRADGSFRIDGLRPGQYFVRVWPPGPAGLKVPMTKFTEEEQNKVDEGLAVTYWPGSRDLSGAGAVSLIPGTPTDLSAIRVGKTPLFRAHVSIRGCEPGDSPRYSLGQKSSDSPTASMMLASPNGLENCADFLVPGLQPGSWELLLQTKQKSAVVPVEIGTRNVTVTAALEADGNVSGELVPAHGGIQIDALGRLIVSITSSNMLVLPQSRVNAAQQVKSGKFSFAGVRGPSHTINVMGLSKQFYVKEVRVDGVSAPGGLLTLRPASRIEVVIDDQPPTLAGIVTEGDQGAEQPRIYLRRIPPVASDTARPNAPPDATGDADGRFQIAGLVPGQYRVLALPGGPIADGEVQWKVSPQVWEQAETVTLERGKSIEVKLKVTDPLR